MLTLLALGGCAMTGQKWTERAYTAPDAAGDQYIESETTVKNRTIAPPFGSKANSAHNFTAGVDADGNWNLVMGSEGELEGGEIATMIQALTGLTAEITKLIASLQAPGVAPLLAPLTEGGTP